jgi:hypothetical protein
MRLLRPGCLCRKPVERTENLACAAKFFPKARLATRRLICELSSCWLHAFPALVTLLEHIYYTFPIHSGIRAATAVPSLRIQGQSSKDLRFVRLCSACVARHPSRFAAPKLGGGDLKVLVPRDCDNCHPDLPGFLLASILVRFVSIWLADPAVRRFRSVGQASRLALTYPAPGHLFLTN